MIYSDYREHRVTKPIRMGTTVYNQVACFSTRLAFESFEQTAMSLFFKVQNEHSRN